MALLRLKNNTMNKKQNSTAIYCILVIIMAVFWGCSIEQRNKALTIFFDGVPPLHPELTTNKNVNNKLSTNATDVKKKVPEIFIHKPYLERKCEKCHTEDRHLVKEMPSLCYQCHKDFSETYKYVHGPVSSGNCTKCHNQHSAPYAKLLIRPGQSLCLYCHNTSLAVNNKYHRRIGDAECTTCHNPHGGNNRNLLKENVASKFGGLAKVNELASKHLFAQVYVKEPGDIKAGTEIIIQDNDQNFQIVGNSITDANGRFSIANVHGGDNYTFKTKVDLPDSAKVVILDYKDKVLYEINKNSKGKFNFDKSVYEVANKVIVREYGSDDSLQNEYASNTKTETNKNNLTNNNNIENKLIDSGKTNPDISSNVENKINKNIDTSNNSIAINNKASVNGENNTTKPNNKTVNNSIDSNLTVENALNGNSINNVNVAKDLSIIKLAGTVYYFKKGTGVRVLNETGDIIAIAKVDDKGNFMLEKMKQGNETLSFTDTNDNTQNVVLYYNMNPNYKEKKMNGGSTVITSPSAELGFKQITLSNEETAQLFSVVYYEYAKSDINSAGMAALKKVAEHLKQNPEVNAYLAAHTDSRGTVVYNQQLSDKRAQAAMNYLLSQGIAPKRIKIKGFGKSKLKNKCSDGIECTEAEHQENRRVEISILIK